MNTRVERMWTNGALIVGLCLLASVVPASAALSINDFAVFGAQGVDLGPNVKVFAGLVGGNADVSIGGQTVADEGIRSIGKTNTGTNAVSGKIVSNGDVFLGGGSDVNGNVDTSGNLSTGTTVKVFGDVTAGGTAYFGGSSTIQPDAITTIGGNLLAGAPLSGSYDTVSTGTSVKVYGDVGSRGSVKLPGSVRVFGDVTLPGGNANLSLATTAKIDGFVIDALPTVTPETFSAIALPAPTPLPPGPHPSVSTSVSGSWLLTAGSYVFDSITIGPSSTVTFDLTGGPIDILIANDVTIGTNTKMFLLNGTADMVSFEVHGNWVSGDVGQWSGLIYASNPANDPTLGNITWGKNSYFLDTLLWAQNTVKTANHVTLTGFQPPEPTPTDLIPEPATCLLLLGGLATLAARRRPGR